jgi:hypothetical protein
VTVNGDDDAFLANAVKLLDDDYRKEVGNNARKLLEHTFSVNVAAKQIVES